ncbi:MAG: DUF1844 domain-containing protein [Gemmatimonadales bacterium]
MNQHFVSLVMGLAAQADAALNGTLPPGVAEDAAQPRQMAQMLIDTLSMLEEKTSGRLDPDEEKLLREALTALRVRFVQSKE